MKGVNVSRNQWLILAALAVGLLLWLRRTQVASTPQALNTLQTKAWLEQKGVEQTGYYDAADVGYKSFADSAGELAGKSLVIDIREKTGDVSNNLPYDPNQSAVVI